MKKIQEAIKKQPSAVEKIKERIVMISLHGEKPCKVTLEITYLVRNSSWTPSYDVRVNSNENVAWISYYGHIKQKTGENWDQVCFCRNS